MKTMLMIGTLVGLALGATQAMAADQTVKFKIANMTCVSCPYIVKKSISAVSGVSKVEISFEEKTAASLSMTVRPQWRRWRRQAAMPGILPKW